MLTWKDLGPFFWVSTEFRLRLTLQMIEMGQALSSTPRQLKEFPVQTAGAISMPALCGLYIQMRPKSYWTLSGVSSLTLKVILEMTIAQNRQTLIPWVGVRAEGKLEMQADLQDLIVKVLRKYPQLSYFQVRRERAPDLWKLILVGLS